MSRMNIAQFLNSLQQLFYRVAHLRLKTHIESYQGDKGNGVVEDISVPLAKHIDGLAKTAAKRNASPMNDQSSDVQTLSETKTGSSHSSRRQAKVEIIRKRLNGLTRLFKKRGTTIVVQPHLSDKLKKSVRQHLNAALRLARQGDIDNAKLHADLTCNAMHQLVSYMPQEEFTQFNSQISAKLEQYRDQDVFRPLVAFLD